MSVKRHPMKSIRQKKITRSVSKMKLEGSKMNEGQSESQEAEIIRQFHQIQKGYSRLMNDVAKELYLVKNWIGNKTAIKRNDFKARFWPKVTKI